MQKNKLSLSKIAELTNATVIGDCDFKISGFNDLMNATEFEISFLGNKKFESYLNQSKAGAIFISPHVEPIEGKNYLVCEFPSLAFQQVVAKLKKKSLSEFTDIHPTAVVSKTAKIGKNVTIGPYSVIDQGVEIKKNTSIGSHVFIGAETKIGENCTIYSHVTIREECQLQQRVMIQSGAVIGSCGFGYVTNPKTGSHTKLEQLGTVLIEDDVEIGSNTTIDRASFKVTVIAKGTKIDNLVQIAHEVHLGEDNLIVSQTGIAGSTKTGKRVIMGGQVGVIGHITIHDDVILTARTAPTKSIKEKGIYAGAPATPLREFNEQMVYLRSLKKWIQKFKALEKRINEFQEKGKQGVFPFFKR